VRWRRVGAVRPTIVGAMMNTLSELTRSSASVARFLRSSDGMPAYTNGSSTFCTLSHGAEMNVWNTNQFLIPYVRQIIVLHRRHERPASSTRLVGRVEAADQFMRVDFPDPDGPMIASTRYAAPRCQRLGARARFSPPMSYRA